MREQIGNNEYHKCNAPEDSRVYYGEIIPPKKRVVVSDRERMQRILIEINQYVTHPQNPQKQIIFVLPPPEPLTPFEAAGVGVAMLGGAVLFGLSELWHA